jgi:enoyl-CoA hydratase/carnithine racemase
VQAAVHRVASLAPQAARMNKQIFRSNQPVALAEYVQAATKNIAEYVSPYAYADSAEHREGIAAFLDKRSPHF